MKIERRYSYNKGAVASLRKDGEDKPSIIEGYAAVYYDGTRETEYEMWPGCIERIMPGAFDGNLDDDVRGLFDHRSHLLLGRNLANTMTLSVDDRGLKYEIDVADTTVGRDVAIHLQRKDVTGSSFAFVGPETEWLWDQEIADGEYTADIRQITSFRRLLDVGPVTYPAYEGTTSGARGSNPFEEAREAYDAAKKEQRGLMARYKAAATLAGL